MAARRDEPYAVLGLPRTATRAQIARTYRRLVKQLHPDVAGADPAAAERFAAVNDAYRALTTRPASTGRKSTASPQTPVAVRIMTQSGVGPEPPIVAGPVRITRPTDRRRQR